MNAALGMVLLVPGVVLGCSSRESACSPLTQAQVEARYSLAVVAACPDRTTRPECMADRPDIEATWEREAKAAGCLK